MTLIILYLRSSGEINSMILNKVCEILADKAVKRFTWISRKYHNQGRTQRGGLNMFGGGAVTPLWKSEKKIYVLTNWRKTMKTIRYACAVDRATYIYIKLYPHKQCVSSCSLSPPLYRLHWGVASVSLRSSRCKDLRSETPNSFNTATNVYTSNKCR